MHKFSKLTFTEWLIREYGDDWPESDEDFAIWDRYIEYLRRKELEN